MAKSEFVMLSTDLRGREPPKGWFVSTKLDGQRALWDGGVSRRYLSVPWSRDTVPPTGLWSRYGKVIHAPDWWVERLPKGICLDGELYLGPQSFQELRSIVSRKIPDSRWENVEYHVFDVPSPKSVWNDREYNGRIVQADCLKYYSLVERERTFGDTLQYYKELITLESRILDPVTAFASLGDWEEGIMLRNPNSVWVPVRSRNSLKMKKERVAEGVVVGVTAGKGKYEGMVGALIVRWQGITFQLSGMTDAERRKDDWIGSQVTFKYREVTNDGLPKEARFVAIV